MRFRDAFFIFLAAVYGFCFINLTTVVRARAEARTQEPSEAPQAPSFTPTPVLPQVPEAPTFATPNLPAMPAMPGVPAPPVAPEAPSWDAVAWSWSTPGGSPASDCSDLNLRLHDNERPTTESDERTITKAEAPVLRVREIQNSGVQVQGWDKDTYSVTACKAAVGPDATQLLSQIKLSIQGGEVALSPPTGEHEDWTVFLLIRTPRSANVEVTTHNGPVSFLSVDGKITTRSANGPISLRDCSGEADISADNGPLTLSGTSGKLHLHTHNGPITVSLDPNWSGSELVAEAVNGPLTLRVPPGFHSGFLVESSDRSPVRCRASICAEARKTWDEDHRRIEYGSGSPAIRLSTQNGPISVAD
jgi:hypothetical protein